MAINAVLYRRQDYQLTRRLALAGMRGPALFVIVFLVLGFIKPGYDPVTRMVSEGSIGELGWIQIANFLAFGAAMLAFSLGLWLGFGDRLSGRIGSALIGIWGVGLLAAGAFVSDPYPQIVTTHGALHLAAAVVGFNGLALACFFFAKRLWSGRPFAIWSIATGVFIHIANPLANVVTQHGLVQRILIIVVCTWLTFLALRLWRSSSPQLVGHMR
jgi:hypothetical protein